MQAFSRDLLDALAEHAALSSDLVGSWGTPQQIPPSRVTALRDHFHELLLRAQALPDGTPEIHAVNLAVVEGLTLMQAAYDKYLAGLEQANLKLLGQGDRLIKEADTQFTKVLPAIEKVVGGPSEGTIVAEVLKLRPVVQQANIELTQALALNAKMLAEVKHGSLKQATKLAAEAKRHVDRGISRL
jgi:hypothetical protein